MFSALDSQNNKIWIDDSVRGKAYHCELCGLNVIQKKGEIRQHHFAHYNPAGHESHSICLDKWKYDMSEWHKQWQERFPVECREVIVKNDGAKHFADVKVNNTVVEFQHSPLSSTEFKTRNAFYKAAGNQVIWVFDVSDKEITEINNGCVIPGFNAFKNVDIEKENVTVFLDYGTEDVELDSMQMVQRILNSTHFYDYPGTVTSVDNFVSSVMNGDDCVYAKYFSKPEIKEYVPGMNSVFELWSDTYKYMIIQNMGHPDKPFMLIFGNDGHMDNCYGHVTGYYTRPVSDPIHSFQRKSRKYNVWYAERQIWKLISYQEEDRNTLAAREEKRKRKKEAEQLRRLYTDWDLAIRENNERNRELAEKKRLALQKQERELNKRHRLFPSDTDDFAINIRNSVNDQSKISYDSIGRRWVCCCGCGLIATDGSFVTYGGSEQTNIGVCKICYESGVRMKPNQSQMKTKSETKWKLFVCPDCGGRMQLRSGKYGQFYGCSNFPKCKYTSKYL